jgi:hypothetical protein
MRSEKLKGKMWNEAIVVLYEVLFRILPGQAGSQNKQRLFPYTALTDWFYNRDGVCLLRGTD